MPNSDFSSQSSDSTDEFDSQNKKLHHNINVLKYLPQARKILDGHHYEKQITLCKYPQQLNSIPNIVIAKDDKDISNRPNLNSRLIKLQQAAFQHNIMKQKIKGLLQKQQTELPEKKITLWSLYSAKQPVYARFGNKMKKNNFSNNLMSVNDINIQIGNRFRIQKPHKNNKEQHKMFESPDSVRFQSHFQSGNLAYAYRIYGKQLQTYDLILQNDINTKGHIQWFFFKMTNTKRHNRIRINIVNFTKQQSMFSYGIKPLTFSEKQYNSYRIGWCRNGQKIYYEKNKIKRQNNLNKNYYTLSFQYYFTDCDTVYFAPNYPYTFTQLNTYCDNLMDKNVYNNMISIKPMVETIGANKINVITIGCAQKEIQQCRVVWVIARQHPGETIGSFMVQGIINYLLQYFNKQFSSNEANIKNGKNKKNSPLEFLVFKIVPMINIDGVIHGNTRSNLAGIDPNRMWKKSLKRLCPQVAALKKMILSHKDNIQMVLDLHSHSKKMGCFFYSNTVRHNPQATKIFPTLVCQADDKQRFNLKNCRFRGGYQTTARNVLFTQLQDAKIYTVECSMLGYMKNNRIIEYSISDYYQMGKILIQTFINMHTQKYHNMKQKALEELDKILFNDAEQARSQSSLSDDQYPQILSKNRKKIQKLPKKNSNKLRNNSIRGIKEEIKHIDLNQQKVNTNIRGISAGAFKSPRVVLVKTNKMNHENSFNIITKENGNLKKDQNKTKIKNILSDANNIQQKSLPIKVPKISSINSSYSKSKNKSHSNNQNDEYQLPPKLGKPQTSLKTRFKTVQKKMKKSLTKLQIIEEQNKISVEVQVSDHMLEPALLDLKKIVSDKSKSKLYSVEDEDRLCIIGNSLEEDNIQIHKNQVNLQITPQILSSVTNQALRKLENTIKNKTGKKIPKTFHHLCQNLSQFQQANSILTPHPRRLMPISTKKS